jgi:Aminotransferase class-III
LALSRIIPEALSTYFYCNSGSEAVDNAVKIARAATGRQSIIAFDVRFLGCGRSCREGWGGTQRSASTSSTAAALVSCMCLRCACCSSKQSTCGVATNHLLLTVLLQGGFHGRTIGAMALTSSKVIYRQHFGPLMPGVHIAPYPYCLHCKVQVEQVRHGCCTHARVCVCLSFLCAHAHPTPPCSQSHK